MVLAVDYSGLPWGDIDCEFGPQTAHYTTIWQQQNGLPRTGKLDLLTRQAVAARLQQGEPDGTGGDYVYYPADSDNTILIHRHGPALNYRWDVQSIMDTNDWHGAAYNYVNYNFCS